MGKFYETTSIAYVNAEPHIGFALEMVAADVLARYYRAKCERTFLLTGTDEHGMSVAQAAEKVGVSPKEYADNISDKFQAMNRMLNISNDDFIRTTNPEHIKNAKDMWRKCKEAGDIYKKAYQGLYCVGCESLVNERDLIDGKCPNHPSRIPEKVEEENYFFRLSKYGPDLLEIYKENPQFVEPEIRFNEIKRLVESGLEDISISRPKTKLTWGIEVPDDPEHVMYVWFDALTNYLYPKEWWPADLHIIGKDILRFHAALWPAMLMSAKMELPKKIFVHGFISVEGQKMSKTLGNVIKPEEMINQFGVDGTRYLMLRELPFGGDADFSWQRMKERYNADLANDLGNLLQRTLTMIKRYQVKVKQPQELFIDKKYSSFSSDDDKRYGVFSKDLELISKLLKENRRTDYSLSGCVYEDIEELDFTSSLRVIWGLIEASNVYIQNNRPWELAKEDTDKLADILAILYEMLIGISKLLEPFMPETSKKMKKQLESLETEPLFPRLA